MLNQIQSGRWDRCLRRFFGVKEFGPIAPAVSPEVLPVMVLQPHCPSLYHLRDERLAASFVSVPAVAGNTGYATLQTRENALVVLTKITVVSYAAALAYWIGWDNNNLAGTPVAGTFRDSRRGTVPAIAQQLATVFYGAVVAGPGAGGVFLETSAANAGETLVIDTEIVIAAGANFLVQATTLNQAFSCSFEWRERPLEDTEVGP